MKFTLDLIMFATAIFASLLIGVFSRNQIHLMPHHVTIELGDEIVCEGAIISAHHVLTAAHCKVENIAELLVRAGSDQRRMDGTLHRVDQFITHDNYTYIRSDGKDIAVIHVIEAFKMDRTRQPIALFEARQDLKPTAVLDISSFGETNEQLQQLNVPIMNRMLCKDVYGTTPAGTFCAGFKDSDLRFGMSGSPVTVNLQLAGIMSEAIGCEGNPGVITEVSSSRSWITRVAHV